MVFRSKEEKEGEEEEGEKEGEEYGSGQSTMTWPCLCFLLRELRSCSRLGFGGSCLFASNPDDEDDDNDDEDSC